MYFIYYIRGGSSIYERMFRSCIYNGFIGYDFEDYVVLEVGVYCYNYELIGIKGVFDVV